MEMPSFSRKKKKISNIIIDPPEGFSFVYRKKEVHNVRDREGEKEIQFPETEMNGRKQFFSQSI